MPKEKPCCFDARMIVRTVFRVLIGVFVALMILQMFFNIRIEQPAINLPNIFWNLIGVLLIVWLISWVFRWPYYHGQWEHGRETRILRRRYEKGEISQTQFKRMMKNLKKHSN